MKSWYQSKTLWFNILGGAVVLLQYLGTINVVDPKSIESALVVVNIFLRFKTNTPVRL